MSERPALRVVSDKANDPVTFDEGLPTYQDKWRAVRELHLEQLNALARMTGQNCISTKRNYYEIKRDISNIREYAKRAREMERRANEMMDVIDRIVATERGDCP